MNALTDTLVCDTAVISKFRDSGDFDYYSQKIPQPEQAESSSAHDIGSISDSGSNLNFDISPTFTWTVIIILAIAVLSLIVFLIYKYKASGKKRGKKQEKKEANLVEQSPDTSQDTDEELVVEGVDFDREIRDAATMGDWRRAIRFTYLKSLASLIDCGGVIFKPHRTPSEYAVEASNLDFMRLTNIFLRVVYGDQAAGQTDYETSKAIMETVVGKADDEDQKGGEV